MKSFRRAVAGILVLSALVCSGCFTKTKKNKEFSYDDLEAVMDEFSTCKTENVEDYNHASRQGADIKYLICSGKEAQEFYTTGVNRLKRFPSMKISQLFYCMAYGPSCFFMVTSEETGKGNMYFKMLCKSKSVKMKEFDAEIIEADEYQYLIYENDVYYTLIYQRGDTILFMRVHKKSDNAVEIADAVCEKFEIISPSEWSQKE